MKLPQGMGIWTLILKMAILKQWREPLKKKKGFGLEVFVKIFSTSHPYHLLPTHVTHALCEGGRGKDEEMGLEKELSHLGFST